MKKKTQQQINRFIKLYRENNNYFIVRVIGTKTHSMIIGMITKSAPSKLISEIRIKTYKQQQNTKQNCNKIYCILCDSNKN